MLTILSLAGSVVLAPPPPLPSVCEGPIPAPAAGHQAADPRVTKVIGLWLRQYRRGNWDLTANAERQRRAKLGRGAPPPDYKDRLVVRYKLVPAEYRGELDYRSEISLLCRLATDLGTVDAARAVLEVAAVGLDSKVRYTTPMTPSAVRRIGEESLGRFKSAEVVAFLAEAAAGDPGGPGSFRTAMQAAALRALGERGDPAHRRSMIDGLKVDDPMVRAAAAHALGRLGDAYPIGPLAARLSREGDATALIEILTAIEAIHTARGEGGVKLHHMQMAVIEAGRALGRGDSWRTDMAIVDFLEKFRAKQSIPRLIGLLERYENEPRLVKSGRLAGRLKARTQEVLCALTGTTISADNPAAWREFWKTYEDGFQLAKAASGRVDASGTTSGFFNIPVQGKRVVFVIDVSGSMNQPMAVTTKGPTVAGGGGATAPKIDILKRELWSAVRSLPSDTMFNVIRYEARVAQWRKDLVPATEANKEKFKTWLDGQRAQGATNIYDAMKLALKLKSLVYGQPYDSNVDEVFLLSDGMPTAGEVTKPEEILRILSETNKFSRVRINTIYLEGARAGRPRGAPAGGRGRGGFPGGGAGLMRELAERNGGKFVKP